MTLVRFRQTWQWLVAENRFHRGILIVLLGTNLLTLIALLQAERTVVLVPPILEGQVNVARDSASQDVKEAWALFVTELLGNVTPTNAPYLRKTLEPLLSPGLRRVIAESLDAQVEALRRDQVSVRFEPRSIHYDAARDRVLVSGKQISTGPAADAGDPPTDSTRCGSPSATTARPSRTSTPTRPCASARLSRLRGRDRGGRRVAETVRLGAGSGVEPSVRTLCCTCVPLTPGRSSA